jgi:phosphoribosylaminoimidazole-succinocarboxamide synthase
MDKRVVVQVDIPNIPKWSGKVRERFDVSSELVLFVTTDRISAFDVILPTGIPDKGMILNQLSIFWMELFKTITPNHIFSSDDETCLSYLGQLSEEQVENLKGRMILARRAEVIPIECVVRGYVAGSLWKTYREAQKTHRFSSEVPVLGYELPRDLEEAQELQIPIFTPATKSFEGHDINLTHEEMINHLAIWLSEHPEIRGLTNVELLAQNLRAISLAFYIMSRDYARRRGIIIADTKLELGFIDGHLTLVDELLTPDSSRFWPTSSYQPGGSQESFDKQYVRDWLDDIAKWNHEPPAPNLPEEVVEKTRGKYLEAYQQLTQKMHL